MANQHNKTFLRAQRRQQVTDLYLQGWSQSAIADHLKVAQTTISLDLKTVETQWRASSVRDFDHLRTVEIQKIDLIEREAWAAWQRSQKPAQSAVVNGEGATQKARKTLKNQYGDPRFLEQVNKCISQRRALLGLDATPPVAGMEGNIDATVSLSVRRERVLSLISALGQRSGTPPIGIGVDPQQPGDVRDGDQ